MNVPMWTDVVTAVSSALVPIIAGVAAVIWGRRKDRNTELIRARVDYYKLLAPDLNRLMCYFTFIGTWKEDSPPEILGLKRVLDRNFYSAAPLFSPRVSTAYGKLERLYFSTFGQWGDDARLNSNAYRRRLAWRRDSWNPGWDAYFAMADDEPVSQQQLLEYRTAHDALLVALTRDLSLQRARPRYTTDAVAMNAHAGNRDH
jgi:hypothetical protein